MIPPWTVPPNFLAYMQGGAEAGLGAGRLAQAGQEASARIALAGQQLAAENERAKERNALTQQDLMANLLQRSQSAQMMKAFHDAEVAERMRHNLATEGKVTDKAAKVFDVGRGSVVGRVNPTTGLWEKLFENSESDKQKLEAAKRKALESTLKYHQTRRQKAIDALSRSTTSDEAKPTLLQEINDADQNIQNIGYQLNPQSAPTADNTVAPVSPDRAFQFPSGLRNFGNEGGLFPSVNPSVLAPIPAGGGLSNPPQLIWDHKTGTLQSAQ